jgi:hypothetical protein
MTNSDRLVPTQDLTFALDQLDRVDVGTGDRRVALAGQGGTTLVGHEALVPGLRGELDQLDLGRGAVRAAATGTLQDPPAMLAEQGQDVVPLRDQCLGGTRPGPQQHTQLNRHGAQLYRPLKSGCHIACRRRDDREALLGHSVCLIMEIGPIRLVTRRVSSDHRSVGPGGRRWHRVGVVVRRSGRNQRS